MNPFTNLRLASHSAKDVIEFLSKMSPKIADKIKNAMAFGYTADEIMDFLGKGMDTTLGTHQKKGVPSYERALKVMGDMRPESVKQFEAEHEQKDAISEVLDPGRILSTGLGAAAGGLAGGPVGALAGAAGGFTGYNDLLKRYNQHVEQGGRMGLSDWLKSLIKAGGTAAAVSQAPKLLAAIQAGEVKDVKPGDEQELAADEVVTQAPGQPMEEAKVEAQVEEVPRGTPEKSLELLRARYGRVIDDWLRQVDDPYTIKRGLEQNFRKDRLKSIEDQEGRPILEIIQEAQRKVREGEEGEKGEVEGPPPIPSESKLEQEAVQELEQGNVKPLYIGTGGKDIHDFVSSIGKIDTGPRGEGLSRDVKPLKALKSSNIRYIDYDPKEQKLQTLFAPSGVGKKGAMYEYFDVPESAIEEVLKGSGEAVTRGENMFRAWFTGKNPSIGHAFDKFIKAKDENGDALYPYRAISEKYVKDEDLLKVRDADKVFAVTQYVDNFEDLVLRSKAATRKEDLKKTEAALQDIPDDVLEEMIFAVTKQISQEIKKAKSQGKSGRRYKGGKETEIRRRVVEKARDRGGG
jgi:hypothetical protein